MRSREKLTAELQKKKERLEIYYKREAEMLDKSGVKSYGMGTRNISRYDTNLKDIQEAIKRLEDEIAELEALLCGDKPRKAVRVVPIDI